LGGKRLGGSFVGGLLSRVANRIFRLITGLVLTDATTGIKMIRKSAIKRLVIESNPVGWAFAFELSIKAQLEGMKLGEIPLTSIDRLFGGSSTFKLGSWLKEYLRWFWWGVRRVSRFNRKQKRVVTLQKYLSS
jgi:dolichol-phosphate mannosyltransferase